MTDASIRSFAYRHPRFVANMAMDFIVGDTVFLGTCESISETSVYMKLADPLQPGVVGVVTLYYAAESCSVHAAVAATVPTDNGKRVALRFVLTDDEEKEAVWNLIAKLKLR